MLSIAPMADGPMPIIQLPSPRDQLLKLAQIHSTRLCRSWIDSVVMTTTMAIEPTATITATITARIGGSRQFRSRFLSLLRQLLLRRAKAARQRLFFLSFFLLWPLKRTKQIAMRAKEHRCLPPPATTTNNNNPKSA